MFSRFESSVIWRQVFCSGKQFSLLSLFYFLYSLNRLRNTTQLNKPKSNIMPKKGRTSTKAVQNLNITTNDYYTPILNIHYWDHRVVCDLWLRLRWDPTVIKSIWPNQREITDSMRTMKHTPVLVPTGLPGPSRPSSRSTWQWRKSEILFSYAVASHLIQLQW